MTDVIKYSYTSVGCVLRNVSHQCETKIYKATKNIMCMKCLIHIAIINVADVVRTLNMTLLVHQFYAKPYYTHIALPS